MRISSHSSRRPLSLIYGRCRTKEAEVLRALVARRRQLIQMLTMEKNRLEKSPPAGSKDIRNHIYYLTEALKEDRQGHLADNQEEPPVEGEGNDLHEHARHRPRYLLHPHRSTSRTGDIEPQGHSRPCRARSLQQGQREIQGKKDHLGRKVACQGQHCIWEPSARSSSTLPSGHSIEDSSKQERLKKLALTACMRKLLTILNTMMKNKTTWIEVEFMKKKFN